MAGREFAIIGEGLYEVFRDGGVSLLAKVAIGNDPATISSGGDATHQLFITSGGNGYIYDIQINALTQIAALAGRATMGDYLDGYFICLDGKTSKFYISDLLDGLTWQTGTNFAQRSLAPDPWKAMKVVGRYLWLFGEHTTEVWQDTGATFPFAPFPSTLLTFGIAAPFSARIFGSDVVWLGRSVTGRTCVLRGTGVTPSIISSYPIESAINTYTHVEAAVGDVYADHGHTFYLLSFDYDNVTWAYDGETQLWCERGTWLSEVNRFSSWRPRFYAFAYDEHRMLDSSSGYVYRMSSGLTTDVDGLEIRRMRRAPAIMDENKRVFYSSFELDLEPGLGDRQPKYASFSMAGSDLVVSFTGQEYKEPTQTDAFWQFDSTVTGGTAPYTYLWDCDDGTTETDEDPKHTFNIDSYPGTHTFAVKLTVTDDVGSVAEYSDDIEITWA
jgi:hypothetical protein